MALTLGNQREVSNDMLIKGIVESIVTVNQFYQALPFQGIHGNALAYNRELAGEDQKDLVTALNTGATSINKDEQKFSRHSTELTTIVGDAQVNGLIQAVGSDFNNATAVQVAAKAKGVGRKYMDLMINGNKNVHTTGDSAADTSVFEAELATAGVTYDAGTMIDATPELTAVGAAAWNSAEQKNSGWTGFDGMESFTAQAPALAGTVLDKLDIMIDSVTDKDGMVDYLMTNSAGVRKISTAFRAAGTGFDMMDVRTSSGAVVSVQSYRGVPIYRNDFITTANEIFCGTLDDGSLSHGISGLTAKNSAGIQVQKLGARENADADITRVKWYCGLAHFSELGLAKGTI